MATAIQSGLHNIPANWDTGAVPAAPEPIVIPAGIVITQSGSWSIGDGLGTTPAAVIDVDGELVVSGDTLTCAGDVTLNGTLTHDFASTLLFSGGNWQITQGAVAVWRTSNGSGLPPRIDASIGQHWTWRAAGNWDPVEVAINGLEIYRCGSASVTGLELRGNNDPLLNFQMRNILWSDCGQMRLGASSTHHIDAICQVDIVVVIRPQRNGQPAIDYAANFPAGWVAGSRYLRNIYVGGPTPNGNPTGVRVLRTNDSANPEFEVSVHLIDGSFNNLGRGLVNLSGSVIFDAYTGGASEINMGYNGQRHTLSNMTVYADRLNAHIVGATWVAESSVNIVVNLLVDCDSPGGPNVLPHKASIEMRNSLCIGINPWYSTHATVSFAAMSIYEHCTHICTATDAQPSMLQETNEISPDYYVYGQSNVRVNMETNDITFAAIQPSIPGAINQYRWLDYNAHYTPLANAPINPYSTVVITGKEYGDVGFGANDLINIDPQFVDPSHRRLADYDALVGGPGDARNLFRECFKKCGYDINGNAVTWDHLYDIDLAADWVRAGYVPQNAALKGAAHDGGDIGAFAVQTASITQSITTHSIASSRTLSNPNIVTGAVSMQIGSILSAAAIGSPALNLSLTVLEPLSINSLSQFGSAQINPGIATITPSSISSSQAVSSPIIHAGSLVIVPSSIDSAAIVNDALIINSAIIISSQAIATARAVSNPAIENLLATIYPQGTVSSQAIGNITIVGGQLFIDWLVGELQSAPALAGKIRALQ